MPSTYLLILALLLPITPLHGQPTTTSPTTPQATTPAVPAGVAGLLTQIERAVLAQDKPAYMALVVPEAGPLGDQVFRTEHGRWADDWVKNRVEVYQLRATPAEPGLGIQGSGPDRFVCRLKTTWKLPSSKRTRSTEFDAVFVRTEAGAWLYAGEAWSTAEHPATATFAGARVKFNPADAVVAKTASIAGAAMPEVRAHVDDFLGVKPTVVQEIKLYRSLAHLQHSIWLSYTEPLGGWNEPGEAIKVLVTPDSVRDIRGFLAHEYAHVATFVHGPNATNAPWWLLEGIAELASANYRPGATVARQRTIADWAAQDQFAPWEAIAPFPLKPEDEQYYRHVYTQGEDMLAWQTEQFGAQARNAFVASVCKGDSLDVASTKAFGKPWAAIDALWRNAAALLVKPEPENAP